MIITMSLPMTDPGNWQDEMIDAYSRGARVRRIFLNYLDDDCWNPNPNGPYLKIGEWNPGEIAGDAARNHVVPMYDMSQISPAFRDMIQRVAIQMNSVGLIPWIVFDDWCSEVEEDWRQFLDPTYGNCQLHNKWNADPPSAARQYGGGNQALELNPYRDELERYVIGVFKMMGHTEIWAEPKNEYGYEEGPAYSFKDMENWYRLRCEHLHKLGFKVVGSINGFITAGMIAPYIDLYDQHGIITTAEADQKMVENGLPYSKVIWNTDGSWSGEGTIPSYYDKYDMSEAQGETLGAYAKAKGTPHICYLCQSQIGPDHWNADDIDNRPVDGLKRGMEPEEPDPDLVFMNVCTETLLLPNEYCPSVYAKSFIVGEEPTTVCTVHSKPDEEDTMWEQIMDWLFGDGSTWQKHPWACVGGLLLVGFIIGAIVL